MFFLGLHTLTHRHPHRPFILDTRMHACAHAQAAAGTVRVFYLMRFALLVLKHGEWIADAHSQRINIGLVEP